MAIVSQLCISFPYVLHGLCEDYLTCDIAFNAVMPLSRASTRGRYNRIEGVTGYQLFPSKIQGTQALIHYIERSTTQLVEYKALNLVDVGSIPMVEITSYDVIINELYTKVPAHYCIMTRPLGATLVEFL